MSVRRGVTKRIPIRNEIYVESGNGHGSTNTVIRRFTTTNISQGKAITYADSATNGALFTINEKGIYSITYTDSRSAAAGRHGVSVNSTELTTSISTIAAGTRIGWTQNSTGLLDTFCATVFLTPGDLIRPHTDGNSDAGAAFFRIIKIA